MLGVTGILQAQVNCLKSLDKQKNNLYTIIIVKGGQPETQT